MCWRCSSTRNPFTTPPEKEQANSCLAAVQTINHRQWQVDYDPLSVSARCWDSEEAAHSPPDVVETEWVVQQKERRRKKKTEERLLSQSRAKYCCLTRKGSQGESVFYCHGRRVPIWRKISRRSSLYASMLVKPKLLCKVGDRMQAV